MTTIPGPGPVHFDGVTYNVHFDYSRLRGQLAAVYDIMRDGQWRTIAEIAVRVMRSTGHWPSEASISARLRDLRKQRYGCHNVERRRRGEPTEGLYEYRLAPWTQDDCADGRHCWDRDSALFGGCPRCRCGAVKGFTE